MSIKILKQVAFAAMAACAGAAGAAPYVSSPVGQPGPTVHVFIGDDQPGDGDTGLGFYAVDVLVNFDPAVLSFVSGSETPLTSGSAAPADFLPVVFTPNGAGQLHGAVVILAQPGTDPFLRLDFTALSLPSGGTTPVSLVPTPGAPGFTNYGSGYVDPVVTVTWASTPVQINSAVPEPAAWLLALAGLAVLPAVARRQRRPH